MFMEIPVSGLHRLFHTSPSLLSSHSAKNPESVTEDAHTYDLLYPDPHTLRQTQNHAFPLKNCNPSYAALNATSHDDRGGMDIHSPRDVRIIIAQDGNANRVLYDSQPSPPSPLARQHLKASLLEGIEGSGDSPGTRTKRRNSSVQESQASQNMRYHGRSLSFAQIQRTQTVPISPRSPEPEFRGAFSNPKLRRSRPSSSGGESTQARVAREAREETDALLGCMFGSLGLPTVSSTKLHVRSAKSPDIATGGVISPVLLETGSSRGLPRRRTPLTRSTTMEELRSVPPSPLSENENERAGEPKKSSILLTRIFTIDPPSQILPSGRQSETTNPTPISTHPAENHQQPKLSVITTESEKPKQMKNSTYAIGILLQLPSDRHRSLPHSSQDLQSALGHGQNYFSQSPQQVEVWPWDESNYANPSTNDMDRSIETVMGHWTVLNRIASSLETVAKIHIEDLLLRVEANQVKVPAQIPITVADTHSYPKSKQPPQQPSQRAIHLPSGALQQCDAMKKEVEKAQNRIALTLRIRKAIAGQNRWGIWREEARWVDRWAGRREQNFFFYNLLTAFLGTHTDWLDAMASLLNRRRRSKQAYQSRKDVSVIQNRTVIVSTDKMAARRLIFLLSAFLPSTQIGHLPEEGYRSHSPWPTAGYSQSPPSAMSAFREQSLRRKINRRPRGTRAAANVKSHTHARGVSFSDQDFTQGPNGTGKSILHHGRRASDATSIRSLPVPISSSGSLRKSSFATIGTMHHDTLVPVPHFSSLSPESLLGTSAEARPGSSGSFASISLKHTLQRSESAECSNTSTDSGRWSNLFSGFWTRRGSSTDGSDALSSQDGLGISGVARDRRPSRPVGKLAQMVEEVDKLGLAETRLGTQGYVLPQKVVRPTSVPAHQDTFDMMPERSTPAKNIPERPKMEFPIKLSVNEKYGVVDVDLGMPSSFSSSFASSFSSPRASHTCASSLNESSLYGRYPRHEALSAAPDSTSEVAGWLKNFHQDFALQAVKPYTELKEDIWHSMRSEPIQMPPSFAGDQSPAWTEVCSTLIADAQSFSITRLTLRRRAAPISKTCQNPTVPSSVEEEMVTEKIMDLDATLTDAVEHVLGQSTHSSRMHSRTASPSRQSDRLFLEVPRSECGKWVLGALEQVARGVAEETGYGRSLSGHEAERSVESDSTLREGVRKWLNATAVWP